MLDAHIIESYMAGSAYPITLDVRESVDSTNDIAKQAAVQGAQSGYCCIAAEQTKGKGQRGKGFFSPQGSGVYLSILIRPQHQDAHEVHYTTLAAVAAAYTINEIAGHLAHIKWVNDIYVGSHKVCGILTEGHTNASGSCDYVVIGIGINVFEPTGGWPSELAEKAGAVFACVDDYSDARERLAAQTICTVFELLQEDNAALLDSYKQLCPVQNKTVTITRGSSQARRAQVVCINDDFSLTVRYTDDDSTQRLFSSSASIIE